MEHLYFVLSVLPVVVAFALLAEIIDRHIRPEDYNNVR